ncbi:hypothetical protein ACYOEI_37400, partial [Singulisphaera rosea]
DRTSRVAIASGQSDAFLDELSARAPFSNLTDHRLYWESIATALAGKPKVVLDPDKTRHRHLILPDVPLGAALPALAVPTNPASTEKGTP